MRHASPVSSDALARHVVLGHVPVEGAERVGQVVAVVVGEASVAKRHDATDRIVAAFRFRNPDVSGLAEARLQQGVPRLPLVDE